ncbi:MAG: exodeoxyribonuclease III [Acidobacteria bacterium]|nr:MAG: exodeoxyribonuclease III [Acidobacteriota bacterium]
MKLLSWNVNGIRAAGKKGLWDWFASQQADIVAFQETKAQPSQLDEEVLQPKGYQSYWHSAEKRGYSGVATYTKRQPVKVHTGLDVEEFDREGRSLTLEFDNFVHVNAYFPNSQRNGARLDYKLRFCHAMMSYLKDWVDQGKNVILCGDYNIAHKEIDLKNPKTNQKNAGFLPEERAWMTEFTSQGFTDVFRQWHPNEPDHYTWWSYRPGVRDRNIGWRIDYHCVNNSFADRVKSVGHQSSTMGSDHCPIYLELR